MWCVFWICVKMIVNSRNKMVMMMMWSAHLHQKFSISENTFHPVRLCESGWMF